ncbi:hypothetical protein PC114_g4050 [Phytophthora cactorum]|uniref:Uncharacterized protein n=1 Tax=Phytophthora cactorum TaxID=29920 RepID=A0A8T1DDZ1_9STRA|nr:hypothetical protein PC114_g4050 [Phytophthora cactorum]KAG2938966.1 hypothetical protein PC115_g3423 [Phytophthora cactorum]KAG3101443.1 hypothetical protein PC122_g2705 [Phytophthora cactorum]
MRILARATKVDVIRCSRQGCPWYRLCREDPLSGRVPMIVVFVLSAVWTFTLAYIQVHATEMANSVMNTTHFDNGEFWADAIINTAPSNEVNSAVDTGVGNVVQPTLTKASIHGVMKWLSQKCSIPKNVRDNYFTAALDLPKLIFQTTTLTTYLSHGFPTPIVYLYSVLLLCNWLVVCYRSQRYVADPKLIIARLYYTMTCFLPSLHRCSPRRWKQSRFSSGDSLFFKSALNLLSLYKWRKIILTLFHNHHERRLERERTVQVQPLPDKPRAYKQSFRVVIVKKIEATTRKPKLGKHFVPKFLLSLIFFVVGTAIFIYSIGSVRSSRSVCSNFEKCVVISYRWNFGVEYRPCLVFADRQTAPRTYSEWTNPEDTTSKLAELAYAGELRIMQIINRSVPELPEELRKCQHLQQLILVYMKTLRLPEWMSEFSQLEYFHVEGDTSKRLQIVPAGIFDHMPHLTFIHFGGIPDVEEVPSFSSLGKLRYLTLAILNSLKEFLSFEGLSKLTALNIVEATRAKTLPSLTPLVSLKSLGLHYRTGVCCNGYLTGTCDFNVYRKMRKIPHDVHHRSRVQ